MAVIVKLQEKLNKMQKLEKIIFFSTILFLLCILFFLLADLLVVQKNLLIKVENKTSEVRKNQTVYLVQTKNKTYSLAFDLLAQGTENLRYFSKIERNKCYLVDISGFDLSFVTQSITKLQAAACK